MINGPAGTVDQRVAVPLEELLFDDATHFSNTGKYTLAPLQDVGADA